MSTLTERDLDIHAPTPIYELPPLRGIEGDVRLENPGVFAPGRYVLSIDLASMTARIERRA